MKRPRHRALLEGVRPNWSGKPEFQPDSPVTSYRVTRRKRDSSLRFYSKHLVHSKRLSVNTFASRLPETLADIGNYTSPQSGRERVGRAREGLPVPLSGSGAGRPAEAVTRSVRRTRGPGGEEAAGAGQGLGAPRPPRCACTRSSSSRPSLPEKSAPRTRSGRLRVAPSQKTPRRAGFEPDAEPAGAGGPRFPRRLRRQMASV